LKKRKRFKFVSTLRELKSYSAYTKRNCSEYYLKRWNGYLPNWLSKVSLSKVGRFALSHIDVDFEKFVPCEKDVVRHIESIRPDVVYATPMNMRFSGEVEYAKAAKSLGIKVVSSVLSWDNLTTKGLFHVKPDILFVWNEAQKKDAVDIHGISPDNIKVSGAPFFDRWFDEWPVENRGDFCKKVGIDPSKPYLLYFGSSKNIAEDETWVIERLAEHTGLQILVKPHPFYITWPNYKRLMKKFAVLYSPLKDDEVLRNAIYHSEFTAGINTSAMIDSVVLGKPCVAVIAEKYSQTQAQTDHFKVLLSARVVDTHEIDLSRVLKTPVLSEARRKLFVKKYIWPNGHAGRYICRQIRQD